MSNNNTTKKKYWQGIEELKQTPALEQAVSNEFSTNLPFEDTTTILDAATPRRDFLKYLGFSTAAAVVAASCEIPVRKGISWAVKPNDITPGVPLYYASAFVNAGEVVPVVVKTRDARPIKIEGNKESRVTQGGTSARVQASVLGLYDVARLKQPTIGGKEQSNWADVDAAVIKDIQAAAGKSIYLVTSTINSNTVLDIISKFASKYSNVKHIQYDAMSYSGLLDAAATSTGKRAIPSFMFDAASTIVSIGADFLGTWISPVEYAKAYSKGRKVSKEKRTMSKHYQIEGMMTISGGSSDVRATARPSEYGKVAVALLGAINGSKPALASAHLNATIEAAAADLKKGNGLVVCGSNDKATQEVVFAINSAIGAFGKTINTAVSDYSKKGSDADFTAFIAALKAGQVGGAFFADCNPVYETGNDEAVIKAIKALPLSVSFNDRNDETTQVCKIAAPASHWLETWGDYEYKTGHIALQQPTINQLFKTRPMAENLLRYIGDNTSYADYFLNTYKSKLGGDAGFDKAIQLGLIQPDADAMGGGYSGNASAAIAAISAAPSAKGDELVIYEKVGIGHGGSWSNNPWLQEMPDPITKCTWDNYVAMSPRRAKELGAEQTDINEVQREKYVMKVTVGNKSLELPVAVVPGMHDNVVAIAVGYGRDKGVGRAAWAEAGEQGGENAYKLVTAAAAGLSYYAGAKVENTNKTYSLAITQTHHSYEGREGVVKETTLSHYASEPDAMYNERMAELHHFTKDFDAEVAHEGGAHGATEAHGKVEAHHDDKVSIDGHEHNVEDLYRKNGTLYPMYEPNGLKWGMSIDLNSCIGCGACTIACQAENNVSVVGKKQVMLVHDMHWLRIDRYYTSTKGHNYEDILESDTIQTVYMPMMCQHCDNAPCENVCPVNATNHSNEGINQMAYNRCIGTRYCANNCPFKVRRFNWRDWNGADSFEDNSFTDGHRDDINDPLTRMVLNPDVTVRSRGVIEKCSFCVQRTQAGKTKAKQENRMLTDNDAVSACAQACPTNAIVFGNISDKESEIYKVRNSQSKERVFYALEELHVLPNVNYLYKVRNADAAGSPKAEAHAAAAHGEKHEEKHTEGAAH